MEFYANVSMNYEKLYSYSNNFVTRFNKTLYFNNYIFRLNFFMSLFLICVLICFVGNFPILWN